MAGRHCSLHGTWPEALTLKGETEFFEDCPECGEKTSYMSNAKPMDQDEAKSRFLNAKFAQYYLATRGIED